MFLSFSVSYRKKNLSISKPCGRLQVKGFSVNHLFWIVFLVTRWQVLSRHISPSPVRDRDRLIKLGGAIGVCCRVQNNRGLIIIFYQRSVTQNQSQSDMVASSALEGRFPSSCVSLTPWHLEMGCPQITVSAKEDHRIKWPFEYC